MAANKYLAIIAGLVKEVFATITSAGAANANQIVALDPTGHLDPSVLPPGIGLEVISVVASEALAAGSFVNLFTNAGVLGARNADASSSLKFANGFVLTSVASAGTATVYLLGQTNTAVTGLTAGADYWLSTVGAVTTTPVATAGFINQRLGKAFTATSIYFQSEDYQLYS
jgi:hypothetical protein